MGSREMTHSICDKLSSWHVQHLLYRTGVRERSLCLKYRLGAVGMEVVTESVDTAETTQEQCVALKEKKPRQNLGEHQ